jgi:hypothetical protein
MSCQLFQEREERRAADDNDDMSVDIVRDVLFFIVVGGANFAQGFVAMMK